MTTPTTRTPFPNRTAVRVPERDMTTALPERPFVFSPGTVDAADGIVSAGMDAVFAQLVREQESETTLLLARRVLAAAFDAPGPAVDPEDPLSAVLAARPGLYAELDRIGDEYRVVVLRERAPLSLTAGCWLDTVSQPATQPAQVVNTLFGQYLAMRGHGNPRRAVHHRRRAALEAEGIYLPDIAAPHFLSATRSRPLTRLLAAFGPALSRLPSAFLPELVGVHVTVGLLGVDDHLLGTAAVPGDEALHALLEEYLDLTRFDPDGARYRHRLANGVRAALGQEQEHLTMLGELVRWQADLTLEEEVADVVRRHAPFAGSQHGTVRVGGRRLADALSDPDLDLESFLDDLHASRSLRPARDSGDCRFLRALKLGGAMFGIFDELEAALFRRWAETPAEELVRIRDSHRPRLRINTVGDPEYATRAAALRAAAPQDVTESDSSPADNRELFHRLVTPENHPQVLDTARRLVRRGLDVAEILFDHGARGRYTDASWFDYSANALRERVDRIYWDKLVGPYRPLEEIPDRVEVVFVQKTFALGSLVDGAWAHRIGNLGHYDRGVDAKLFLIYADEMGLGDVRKNHITLIHQVLASMDVQVPHIRAAAFVDQDEIPDLTYGFALHQLALALFPDSHYDEILGYNLGIEMFGLGEMRLHEIQKLRRHGFDISYEQAHLSIDNVSAGHARQAVDIIIEHLDRIARTADENTVQARWHRVWRGYASFAYFVERELLRDLPSDAAERPASSDTHREDVVELTI